LNPQAKVVGGTKGGDVARRKTTKGKGVKTRDKKRDLNGWVGRKRGQGGSSENMLVSPHWGKKGQLVGKLGLNGEWGGGGGGNL